jgi:putative membrane protein
MARSDVLFIPVILVAMSLPGTGVAQTSGATSPPPSVSPAAPPTNATPAEIMPPSARTGKGGDASPASTVDAVFAKDAAEAGMAEVRMGRLAERQAQSEQVRSFGQQMVTDHTKLGDRLAKIAGTDGLTTPLMLDPKDSRALNDLTSQHGAAFDHAYLRAQIADHQSALTLFQREAAQGTDSNLKRFASDALPTLREHLQMAQAAARTGE